MKKCQVCWPVVTGILVLGLLAGCGREAKERIEDAKQAVEQARKAEAPEYASDEFRSAEESLLLAQKQYDDRSFEEAEVSAGIAETRAVEAREKAMAQKAKAEIEEEKEEVKEELAYNVSSLFGETQIREPSEEEQARVALHDVHFSFDSSEVSKAARGVLALNAEWMKEHPSIKVEIEGHCDERGTEEYNLALGARRAKKVYDYMLSLGVSASRMRTISYGESVPLDPAHNETAWAKNRRAHFAVME